MIDRKLIEEIVKEVLAEKNKPSLLVIHQSTENHFKQVEELKKHWNVVESLSKNHEVPDGIQQAVFLDVDQDLFVKGAVGITDTPETRLFSNLMVQGVRVTFILSSDFMRVLNQNQKGLKNRYITHLLDYQSQLQAFGVRFCSLEKLLPEGKMDIFKILTGSGTTVFSGKLLTQNIVETWKGDCILIQSNTIITPLARDTAKERGIEIRKSEKWGCGTC